MNHVGLLKVEAESPSHFNTHGAPTLFFQENHILIKKNTFILHEKTKKQKTTQQKDAHIIAASTNIVKLLIQNDGNKFLDTNKT